MNAPSIEVLDFRCSIFRKKIEGIISINNWNDNIRNIKFRYLRRGLLKKKITLEIDGEVTASGDEKRIRILSGVKTNFYSVKNSLFSHPKLVTDEITVFDDMKTESPNKNGFSNVFLINGGLVKFKFSLKKTKLSECFSDVSDLAIGNLEDDLLGIALFFWCYNSSHMTDGIVGFA